MTTDNLYLLRISAVPETEQATSINQLEPANTAMRIVVVSQESKNRAVFNSLKAAFNYIESTYQQ